MAKALCCPFAKMEHGCLGHDNGCQEARGILAQGLGRRMADGKLALWCGGGNTQQTRWQAVPALLYPAESRGHGHTSPLPPRNITPQCPSLATLCWGLQVGGGAVKLFGVMT